jgi:hypothetical protein
MIHPSASRLHLEAGGGEMMWTKWTLKLCVPLASAAILGAACTQEVKDNSAQTRTEYGEPRKMEIAVTGCLGAGTGTNQYMLTHVRPVPLASQPSDALSSANLNIPSDSSVRLSARNDEQLTSLVGQTVTVTGLLTDDGRNTIGTSGQPAGANQPESRTDRSQAATDQHPSEKVREEAGPIGNRSMNNGTFPEITVEKVNGTGQKCTT